MTTNIEPNPVLDIPEFLRLTAEQRKVGWADHKARVQKEVPFVDRLRVQQEEAQKQLAAERLQTLRDRKAEEARLNGPAARWDHTMGKWIRDAAPPKVRKRKRPKTARTIRTPKPGPVTPSHRQTVATDAQALALAMLRRPEGATRQALVDATGWKPDSTRAFLSAVVGKKLKLELTSTGHGADRVYRIEDVAAS